MIFTLYYYRAKIVVVYQHRYAIYAVIKTKLFGSQKPKDTAVVHKNHVHIKYHYEGKEHTVRIPRNYRNRYTMSSMILIKNNERIDITHSHGIPYFLTAADLAGDHIIEVGFDGNEESKFDSNEIPKIETVIV